MLTILGATGSVGQSTLDVVRRHPQRWPLYALTAATNVSAMLPLCIEFRPQWAVMTNPQAAQQLAAELRAAGCPTEVASGDDALLSVVRDSAVTSVMAAIVGAAGLLPTLAAAKAGKRVLLANKESLVTAGRLFMATVSAHGAELLPIDSEHNAIFQCLPAAVQAAAGRADLAAHGITRILLTGSGGPFRTLPLADFAHVTPEQACRHPNWQMGRKISVDSATMMNKGLEYIEARWLFNAGRAQLQVVLHPQSVIHSMVQYSDGSVLAQLGQPDMRTPIAHALAYPERISSGVEPLDFTRLGNLSFGEPDAARYPCLALAQQACWSGQAACTVLNAANEEAVAAFLAGRLRYLDIAAVVEQTLTRVTATEPTTIDEVLALDARGRREAQLQLQRYQELAS